MSEHVATSVVLKPPHAPRHREAAVVLALLAAATLVNLVLVPRTSLLNGAMLNVLAIVLISYVVSRIAAVVGAVAAVLCFNFFFVEPRYTLQVDAQENAVALAAMLGVAFVISHLAAVSRRETETARLNERRARQLQELASELSGSCTAREACVLAQHFLSREFPGPCLVVPLGSGGELDTCDVPSAIRDGLLACMREAATLGAGTARWSGLHNWYVPLKAENYRGGAACVQNVLADDARGLDHAQAICALVGQALWRMSLAASVQASEKQSQWHKAQSTFLAAISHDFRTPLASIVAAASSLEVQRSKLKDSEQIQLLQAISGEANHLVALTENTLQLARLDNAGELAFDWQAMEEIVGAGLQRVRARDASGRIQCSVPAGLPLFKGDSVLLTQLVENLLDNALKFSADFIELTVSDEGDHITLAVHDRGGSIAPGDELTMFEPFRRGDRSGIRGIGLGLALCRAIARAHRGELVRQERQGGGSTFVLKLPVEQLQPLADTA